MSLLLGASALGSAVCFGFASVLQAMAAMADPQRVESLDPRMLLRLAGQWRFILGLGIDGLGYVLMVLALRALPVFVVQAAVAASLVVTAIAATRFIGATLSGREWAAAAMVCVGLGLLGLSSGTEGPGHAGGAFRAGLVVAVVLLGTAAALATRLPDRWAAPVLGLVSGISFGAVALASRILVGFRPGELLRDPAAYVIMAAGALAFLCLTTAMQRGSVTMVTALLVVGETVLPSVIGVAVLGDRTRPGYGPVAVLGFLAAVGAALALARFGELNAPGSSRYRTAGPDLASQRSSPGCAVGRVRWLLVELESCMPAGDRNVNRSAVAERQVPRTQAVDQTVRIERQTDARHLHRRRRR